MDDKKQKHILIVDDEPDIINILEVILNKTKQYKLSSATDGRKALDMLTKDASIDLVIADIKMPELDGIEMVNKIKQRDTERPKVILITGFTDLSLQELYDAGACAFITKPFEWQKVINLVDESFKKSPAYNRSYEASNIKLDIKMELESLEAVHLFCEDFALGSGGIAIKSPRTLILGDLVYFNVAFNSGEIQKIEGVGELAWQKVSDDSIVKLGLKFYNISFELESFIKSFCKKNNVKAFIPKR